MIGLLPRIGVGALLALVYASLLATAVVPLPILFFVMAAVAVCAELLLTRSRTVLLPEVLNSGIDVRFRVLSLDMLTAFLAARLLPDAGGIVALALSAVLVLAGARDAAGIFARRLRWRRAGGPVSWRNFSVPGLPDPRPLGQVPRLDAPFTLLGLLIPLGYAIGSVTDRYNAAIAAQWISIAAVLVFLVGRFLQYKVLERPDDDVREDVRAAIERAAPEIVVHHSGRPGTVEQVLLWVDPLLGLERSCMILVREAGHLAALEGCGLPVVFAPRSQDVELFMVASVDVALYTSDSTNINNHLLRVPGIFDVLIGHGDSDEPESRSPIARMYDEIWVAGRAGRERYDYAASGVQQERIREIGAPRSPLRVAPPVSERPVVVYAPSWENVADGDDLSSLVTSGDAILEALLARQDVRTVFVPAAPTGGRLPEYEHAETRLRRRVEEAGGDHGVWPAARLAEALALASFAVVDVSPVLTEAVRADVPFAVPAVQGRDAAAMRRAFPSVGAGVVLEDYPHDVFTALEDALGPDSRAAARLAAGRRIDSTGEFAVRFRAAVDEAVSAQRRRRAFARPVA